MGPKEPKVGTKPRDAKHPDAYINNAIHEFGEQFAEGMSKEDEENLHELDESVPLEKKDDHLK